MDEIEKQKRGFKGIWIPKEIWLSDLSLQEKVFLAEIDSLDVNENGCYASNAYFAKFFQLSKSRCSQIISALEEKKLIEVEQEIKNKQTIKRTMKVVKGVVNILKGGSKYSKGGSKYLHNIYTNLNNTREDNVLDKSKTVRAKKVNGSSSNKIKDTSNKYIKLARKLSNIIQTQKKIKHTHFQIKAWSEEFRKLESVNKVKYSRQKKALKWYKKNIGGEYIPVVESGKSFREKFTKLEDAMKRVDFNSQSKVTIGAKDPDYKFSKKITKM